MTPVALNQQAGFCLIENRRSSDSRCKHCSEKTKLSVFSLIGYYQSDTVNTYSFSLWRWILHAAFNEPALNASPDPLRWRLRSGSCAYPGLHVVPTATERTSALAENSHVATLCVQEVKCVCASACVDPPKEDGRLPGRHRSSSPACFTVSTMQSRARRGDLARLSPAIARPLGSSDDGRPHRRRDSTPAPRLSSSAGPGQTRRPGLWVCHAPEDGHHRPELVSRLRGYQHGSLELHFAATPAGHLRRRERLLPPVPRQEWCVRWRGVPAERGAAAAATQRVSAVC